MPGAEWLYGVFTVSDSGEQLALALECLSTARVTANLFLPGISGMVKRGGEDQVRVTDRGTLLRFRLREHQRYHGSEIVRYM